MVLIITGCAPRTGAVEMIAVEGGRYYTNIPASRLREMAGATEFTLVNVHVPFVGNIPGTDLSIPYDQITQSLSDLPKDRNARIVLYCQSGRMSTLAAEQLVSLGYTNIWNLQGGMVVWEKAGYQIEP
jgi:rhodanese-related sulfurtransferase